MLALTFWKVSPEGRAFTLMGVPPMAVAVVAVVIRVAVAIVMAVVVIIVVAVVIAAAAAMAPGKGSGKNPKKSSLRKKGKLPLGLLTRDGACVGVIGTPINVSPAKKGWRNVKRGAAYPLPKNKGRTRTGRKAGLKKNNRRRKW